MARRKNTDPIAQRDAVRDAVRDALILEIAQRQFRIETLETRNWDWLDFHDVAVWAIRAALEEAFEAGRRAGLPAAPTDTQP